MPDSSTPNALETLPLGLEPPCDFDNNQDEVILWTGEAQLVHGNGTRNGPAKVFFRLNPQPRVRFEIDTGHKGIAVLKEQFFGIHGDAALVTDEVLGQISVNVTTGVSGVVSGWSQHPTTNITSGKYLVINGPDIDDKVIRRGRGAYTGRLQAHTGAASVTVDRLRSKKEPKRAYEVTHVAEIRFEFPSSAVEIQPLQESLFRSLSLSHGRWVGLLGPWLYHGEQLVHIPPTVTKTTQYGRSHSWYPVGVFDIFDELFPRLHNAYQDVDKAAAIQIGLHWLVESSECAGGVEGALILQQAALESLAWYDLVHANKFYSSGKFDGIPAAEKMRLLTSRYSIDTSIPLRFSDVAAYALDNNKSDLLEVLVDVRNALIHSKPQKVQRLFTRKNGDDERTNLWYLIGGVLEHVLLALIGYDGKLVCRYVDAKWITGGIKTAPWAQPQSSC